MASMVSGDKSCLGVAAAFAVVVVLCCAACVGLSRERTERCKAVLATGDPALRAEAVHRGACAE